MSEEIMEIEQSFAEMLEESFKTLNTGDKVTGTVVAITPTEVQVELGIKYPGYIPVSELSDDPDVKVEDIAKVGGLTTLGMIPLQELDGQEEEHKKKGIKGLIGRKGE